MLFALWLVTCLVTLNRAAANLREGGDRLGRIEEVLTLDAALNGRTGPELRSAAVPFDQAALQLDAGRLAPLRLVPVLGRQIRSADALAASSAEILRGATAVAEQVDGFEAGDAAVRVEGLRKIRTRVDELAATTAKVDLGPDTALVGSLAHARRRAAVRLADLQRRLADGTTVLAAADELIGGDRKILVLGATNAEMRVGQGAVTQFGIATVEGASLRFTRPMGRAALGRPPVPVPVEDPDVRRNWPFLDADNLSYIGSTPRFDVVAARAAALVERSTGEHFALVVQLDTVAVARLASLTGPVTAEGAPGPLEGDALFRFLLHDQYEAITDLRNGRENAERREALAGVAAEVTRRVDGGSLSLGRLGEELRRLGRSRNVLVHPLAPGLQAAAAVLGLEGGAVPADGVSVGLLNAGASKLDQFVQVRVDLALEAKGDRTLVTARVSVRNRTPPAEPPYIIGEQPKGTPPQGYAGFLVLGVPRAATNLVPPPGQPLSVSGPDGASQVMATYMTLGREQRSDQVFSFEVPTGSEMTVLPSGRFPGVGWYLGEDRLGDDEPHRIRT